MAIALDYSARTDVGLVRSRNEDSGYAGPHLLAVADGMGGHAGGNVASSIVLARLAPPGEMAAHFGLFALSGRITGFLGPAVLALVTGWTGSQRLGMATIGVFLGLGALMLLTVQAPRRAET